MHPLYSPLGLLAKWNDSLSRQIVNMIPMNWVLVALCALGVFGTNEARQTAWQNGQTPQTMSAAQFVQMSGAGRNHRFVSVKGHLYPKYTLSYNGSNAGELTLMIDDASKRGFWVDNPGISTDGPVELSGLSWQMSSDLRSDVINEASSIERELGVSIDSNIKLNAGQTPGNGLLPLLAEIALAGIGSLFVLLSLKRNIIFQRQKARPAVPESLRPKVADAPAFSRALFLSGKMRLHSKCARRFLAMPAEFARLGDGTLALVTLTDASTYSDGGVSKSRAGLWLCVPKMNDLKVDEGRHFVGWKARPALRLRFGDALAKGRRSSVIVSFENEAARDLARENLNSETAPQGAFR